jgi:hypothetical protein
MQKGDLVEVAVRCSRRNQRVYERGEVGVLVTEMPGYVVGGLFVVHVVIDGKIAEFVNMHIRPLQAAEEGR